MRSLYIVLLLGLFFWGYKLCSSRLCGTAEVTTATPAVAAEPECETALLFKDGDNLNISSDENFSFDFSDESFNSPSEEFLSATIEIIDYLAENADRVMQIKAYYVEGEENLSSSKTLGHARAKSIATFFRDQGVEQSQLQILGKQTISACVQDSVLMKGCSIVFGGRK